MTVTIYSGDCRNVLPGLADDSVDCCVTSPPYWGLRNYDADRQIGMETSVQEYIDTLVAVFSEVRRVLRPDGTLWLNLGDCYTGSGKGGHSGRIRSENWQPSYGKTAIPMGLKPKELVGLPWRVAFALQADGWYLRSDIVWHKPNPMPESVKDRPTRAHEFIFLFSKSRHYHYDHAAIREPLKESSTSRMQQNVADQEGSDRAHAGGKTNGRMKAVVYGGNKHTGYGTTRHSGNAWKPEGLANKKSVWTVATCGLKEAHFATFPTRLIEPCIKAGCIEGGVVLDPFFGAGTTALVAERLNRNCIGVELNGDYIGIAKKRLEEDSGMFANVHIAHAPDAAHSIAV